MNKKFSTLLASALLACGTAFTASADSYVPATDGGTVEVGVNALLKVGEGSILGLDAATGKLVTVGETTATNLTVDELQQCTWTIEKVEYAGAMGSKTYTYKFLHNYTGQYLSVKLQSNSGEVGQDPKSKSDVKIEAGNSEWAWDQTKGLYAVANDSTFYLEGTTLNAAKSEYTPANSITYLAITKDDVITLDAASFNALTKGKLYFNDGKDVSNGQSNVLTANTWTAEDVYVNSDGNLVNAAGTGVSSYLFLSNEVRLEGGNNAKEPIKDKKQYLIVDQKYYDTNTLWQLTTDTLSFDPVVWPVIAELPEDASDEDSDAAEAAYQDALADALEAATADAINARTAKVGKNHPFVAAFTATYNLLNDQITLVSAYQPKLVPVKTTITALNEAVVTTGDDAFEYFTGTQLTALKAAVTGLAADAALSANTIQLAKEEIALVKLDDDATDEEKAAYKAEKAAVDAFIAAVEGLKSNANGVWTSTKYSAPAFVDGVTALQTNQDEKDVVLRTLAGTTVLTIAENGATGNIVPTIQPYKSKPAAGGDATIAEGVYYLKDKNVIDDATYNMYLDLSPVNGVGYVKEAQAFNPYAQVVVKNSPAAAKGNYTIYSLATGEEIVKGVVNKAGDDYVLGADTFALEAAPTKLAEVDKHMGSAYFTAAELTNNTFTVASASAALAGETFAMLADSTVSLAAGETTFKLIAGSEVKDLGYDKKLAYVPYAIMTEDSLVVAKVNDKYVFTTYKEAERVHPAVYFRLLATGSESTYVLYDVTKDDNAKVGINVQTKTIIPVALDVLNDLFAVTVTEAPASYKTTGETAKIQVANGFLAINNDNQAMSVREGDLRSAYTADDFVFTLDTAQYEGAETYTYFITKEVADAKLIMWEATDSLTAEKNAPYLSGLDTRVLFRPLNKIDDDTVYVANLADLAKEDTVKTSTSYQFSFAQVSDDAEDGYIMQSGDKYVAVANGVVVVTTDKENAASVLIETVEGPTANEAVEAAEVSVVAVNGAIIVKGATGKVVTVANILGQTIANQVAASDNVTIAAPAGVAIVTVDGEATKVVVK
ncbi:MAG: DUF6383 domain-containing protein [Parabacteroides sp.]